MINRRTFLTYAGGASAAALMAGSGRMALAAKPDHVTLMTWGGLWGDAIQKSVGVPFTEETGVELIQDRGSSPLQRITKLKVGLDNQVFDLIQLHDGL